jgi:hypothetical protein
MAFIADYVALHDCTQSTKKGQRNSIEPLVRYLKRGHPLTPLLRSWLVELLKEHAVGEFRLEYKRRPGHRKSSDGDLIDHLTYARFLELDGKRINRTLYDAFWQVLVNNPKHIDEMSLTIGNYLTHEQTYEIVGAEFKRASSTVKKVVLKNKNARAV